MEMNHKILWIVLIVAALLCSASCRPGAAKEETTSASLWQQFDELSARATTGLRNMAAELTAPRLKDRQDIFGRSAVGHSRRQITYPKRSHLKSAVN
jgi:hypothetical protein